PAKGRMTNLTTDKHYAGLVGGIGDLVEAARRTSARAVNALMTATYWEVGRRIVQFEQGGKQRAEYGEELLKQLSADLTARFGRGFGVDNLQRFRAFYLAYAPWRITRQCRVNLRRAFRRRRLGNRHRQLFRR